MKTYREEKVIQVTSKDAWNALTCMDQWLPKLSSITALEYDTSSDFFFEGSVYNVQTPEGVTMKSVITKVDETSYTVQIQAHCSILKSRLTCAVVPISEHSCKLVRTQSYPGMIGTIFTTLFHHREANETSEYVDVWGEFAYQLSNTSSTK